MVNTILGSNQAVSPLPDALQAAVTSPNNLYNDLSLAPFKMGPEDLLVPAVRRREPLKIHAEMNTHGDIGKPRPVDLAGDAPGVVLPGAGGATVVLDQVR